MFIPRAHVVFVTRYRVLAARHLACTEQIIRDVRADSGTELAEFNGEAERVHLQVNVPPTVPIPRLARSLNGVSSCRLRQEFPGCDSTTGGRDGCRPGRTSPARPAQRPSQSWASTSSSRTRPPDPGRGQSALTTGLKAGALADILVAQKPVATAGKAHTRSNEACPRRDPAPSARESF